jgi:cephalosporin hydroxylase
VAVTNSDVVADFHRLHYERRIWQHTWWLGVQVLKCPLDLWVYQEIEHRTRPDLIVETGTHLGGSALYLANVCDAIDCGRIVSIDVAEMERPDQPRITYLHGSSTDEAILERVREMAEGRVMVILDSDHSTDHVLAELRAYASLVSPGCYLIVEDTNVGHEVYEDRSGPREAVMQFLAENDDFANDPSCEKFMLTFNPSGYLLKEPGR